ncbi:hypothetical protein OF83DRAFT_1147337 [Amylostereum chailletii]|nr:hypothetical protein OF83DRAFT_1147337 [Amylostereum chailletii]
MLDTRQYDRDITDLYYNTEHIDLPQPVAYGSCPGSLVTRYNVPVQISWCSLAHHRQIVFTRLNESGQCMFTHYHTNKPLNDIIL